MNAVGLAAIGWRLWAELAHSIGSADTPLMDTGSQREGAQGAQPR